jgi:hypothetical protein
MFKSFAATILGCTLYSTHTNQRMKAYTIRKAASFTRGDKHHVVFEKTQDFCALLVIPCFLV